MTKSLCQSNAINRTDPQLPALDSTNEAKPTQQIEEEKQEQIENSLVVEIQESQTDTPQSYDVSKELVDYYKNLQETIVPL